MLPEFRNSTSLPARISNGVTIEINVEQLAQIPNQNKCDVKMTVSKIRKGAYNLVHPIYLSEGGFA